MKDASEFVEGIVCPVCMENGKYIKLKTTDSRPVVGGAIRRLKRCLVCDSRFTTTEKITKQNDKPRAKRG